MPPKVMYGIWCRIDGHEGWLRIPRHEGMEKDWPIVSYHSLEAATKFCQSGKSPECYEARIVPDGSPTAVCDRLIDLNYA